jgi:hypothetical protein
MSTPSPTRRRAMVHAAFCAPVLLAAAAGAQETPAVQPQLSSRAEYLACLGAQDAIGRESARLDQDNQRHAQRLAAVQAASVDLAAQVRRHAPQNKAEVDSYNRAIVRQNTDAATVNAQAQLLRQRQDALNRRIVEYNGRCGTMVVSNEDRAAAEAEHRERVRAREAAASGTAR